MTLRQPVHGSSVMYSVPPSTFDLSEYSSALTSAWQAMQLS
jgi:hypothetical protein